MYIPHSTWSSLFMCRRRCLKKSRREHFLTRIRSVVPSARWAEGDRPFGLRGHAQLMLAELMAMNLPWITFQSLLPSETQQNKIIVTTDSKRKRKSIWQKNLWHFIAMDNTLFFSLWSLLAFMSWNPTYVPFLFSVCGIQLEICNMNQSCSGVTPGNYVVFCWETLVHVNCSIPMNLESWVNYLFLMDVFLLISISVPFDRRRSSFYLPRRLKKSPHFVSNAKLGQQGNRPKRETQTFVISDTFKESLEVFSGQDDSTKSIPDAVLVNLFWWDSL